MLKMIIAEDERVEREFIHMLIKKYFPDYFESIVLVKNGEEAVNEALSLQPDLVLLDIHMPKLNGLDAAAKIKQKFPECRIVILTAYDRFEYAKESIKIGIQDYLVKPYSDEEFCSVIRTLMYDIQVMKEKKENEIIVENQKKKLRTNSGK